MVKLLNIQGIFWLIFNKKDFLYFFYTFFLTPACCFDKLFLLKLSDTEKETEKMTDLSP